MSSDCSSAELASAFAAIARLSSTGGLQAAGQMTLLHIGDEQLIVLSGQGGQGGQGEQVGVEQRLDLGASRIARDFFHHDPPLAGEIERAIDFAEDQVMRLGPRPDAGSTLWSLSDTLQPWATVSGPTMAVETVEQWFTRLALAAHGQVGALDGLPPGREAAATLLVLREFMHHRGHASIVVVEPRRMLAGRAASA